MQSPPFLSQASGAELTLAEIRGINALAYD